MRSFEELQALWARGPMPPRGRGTVTLVVARKGGGVHEVLERGVLTVDGGLAGDRWADGDGDPAYQLTLMNARAATLVCADEQPLHMPGDNIHVDLSLAEDDLPVGARLRVGTALVEVTPEPHLGCDKFRARFGPGALKWVNYKPTRSLRLRGVNLRVVEAGEVAPGDAVEKI